MLRLIFLGLIAYYVSTWLLRRNVRPLRREQYRNTPPPPQTVARLEELVQDPFCRTYIPKSQAVSDDTHFFCSQKCRDAFRAST